MNREDDKRRYRTPWNDFIKLEEEAFKDIRNLREYKDMTTEELVKEREKIEKELFKRLGS